MKLRVAKKVLKKVFKKCFGIIDCKHGHGIRRDTYQRAIRRARKFDLEIWDRYWNQNWN